MASYTLGPEANNRLDKLCQLTEQSQITIIQYAMATYDLIIRSMSGDKEIIIRDKLGNEQILMMKEFE